MQAAIKEPEVLKNFLQSLTEDEQRVAERFLRPSKSKELVFEFTRDVGHLHQYYVLRSREQAHIWGFSAAQIREDEMDRQSHILVARRDNQVMAGARLTISSPRRPLSLPMEQNGFRLDKAFPDLGLGNRKYAEISRVVIETEFQDDSSLLMIFQHLYRKIIATRVEYIFGTAPAGIAASYQRFSHAMGLNIRTYSSEEFPEIMDDDGIKMHLIVAPVVLAADTSYEEFPSENQRETVSIW